MGGNFWSDGYYAGTVDERGVLENVERYIVSQGKPKEVLTQLKLFLDFFRIPRSLLRRGSFFLLNQIILFQFSI